MADLSVKELKDTFGTKYAVINELVAGKPDDYMFSSGSIIDRMDYFVDILWGKEDIEKIIRERYSDKLKPTEENISKVFYGMVNSASNKYVQDYVKEHKKALGNTFYDLKRIIEKVAKENKQEDDTNDD